jgi:uncharacterized protein
MKTPPRVVLDTNVVLSALLFGGGPAARVRAGWQAGHFIPLASAATTRELVRVLAYPKCSLAAGEQQDLLADYLPCVQVVAIPDPPPVMPPCRDPFDLPFLYLAVAGGRTRWFRATRTYWRWRTRAACVPCSALRPFCRQLPVAAA